MPDELDDVQDDSLSARLASRSNAGLSRRGMGDGGEVFSGPTASKALQSMGARAMTMDNTIFVDDGFDANNPEDLALYAHETHHQMESGGDHDGHGDHDHEEVAARSIERMVLHRSRRGDDIGSIMSDVRGGNIPGDQGQVEAFVNQALGPKDGSSDSSTAYASMLGAGKSHDQVVQELADWVVEQLLAQDEENRFRGDGPGTGFY
jgi:hypothetical protein